MRLLTAIFICSLFIVCSNNTLAEPDLKQQTITIRNKHILSIQQF